MSVSVVSALWWAGALAAAIWILVPAIAFALNIGGLRTDVLPDAGPPTLYTEDSVFAPRLEELAARGFRLASRTRERGRFISPIHWSWKAYEAQQWLVSSDGLTHAILYRLAENEPARISVVTMFEDGGLVRTSCPGAAAKEPTRPNYWRFDLRGVDTEMLLARHVEQVERFAQERATRPKVATVAEIAAADNAAERPIVRKMGLPSYAAVALFLPAVFFAFTPVRTPNGMPFAPVAIVMMAGLYALMRVMIFGPVRRGAVFWHTHDLPNPIDAASALAARHSEDIAEDGTILATGKNERRLRLLAATAAVLSCAWPMTSLSVLPRIMQGKPGAIVPWLLFLALGVLTVLHLIWRARGKLFWFRKHPRSETSAWGWLGFVSLWFMLHLEWSRGTFHRVLFVVGGLLIAIAIAGSRLEKTRGQ